jgi:hypothetical protein
MIILRMSARQKQDLSWNNSYQSSTKPGEIYLYRECASRLFRIHLSPKRPYLTRFCHYLTILCLITLSCPVTKVNKNEARWKIANLGMKKPPGTNRGLFQSQNCNFPEEGLIFYILCTHAR